MQTFTTWFASLSYVQVYGLAVAIFLVCFIGPVVAMVIVQGRSQQDD